jgi:undecaprenyl diphosphate synthase
LHKNNIRIKFIGDITKLKPSILSKVKDAMELTKNNDALTVALAVCYGARDEIVTAAKKIVSDNIAPADITEELFGRYLFDPEMPDVDLLIRTSGEHRVCNFLLWQIVYAELYFASKYWPDFMASDLDLAIEDFNSRKRYYGLR